MGKNKNKNKKKSSASRSASSCEDNELLQDTKRMLNDSESGESDMFPGGTELGPERATKAARGGPASSAGKNKGAGPKKSETGRRVVSEDYKSQRVYRDFVAHHILSWLDEVDSVYLAKDVMKDVRRAKLFSAMVFAFGWMPGDPKCGENKQAVVKAAKGQYERRNRPAHHTGWGPDEIHQYMKYQLHQFSHGKMKRESLGGWAWKLPKKDEDSGAPAPLPDEVLKFLKKKSGNDDDDDDTAKKAKKSKPAESESDDADGSDTDDGEGGIADFVLKKRKSDGAIVVKQRLGRFTNVSMKRAESVGTLWIAAP